MPGRKREVVNRFATFAAGVLLSLAVVISGSGCASVTPPKTPPPDPVTVFVTDYGIHSSLVLPVRDDDGLYIEYAFGDFGYAALNRDGPIDAIGALLWSFGSGIGRQYLRVPPGGTVPVLIYAPNRMTRITASRAKVDALLIELEARYNDGIGPIVHNELTKINWRKDRQHYSLFNNCNQLTARQLRGLGYDVRGAVFMPLQVKGQTVVPHAVKDGVKSPGGMSGSR
jgi:hypothetical protein